MDRVAMVLGVGIGVGVMLAALALAFSTLAWQRTRVQERMIVALGGAVSDLTGVTQAQGRRIEDISSARAETHALALAANAGVNKILEREARTTLRAVNGVAPVASPLNGGASKPPRLPPRRLPAPSAPPVDQEAETTVIESVPKALLFVGPADRTPVSGAGR